MAAWMAVQ
jgi:hypothetical protein